MVSSIRKHMNVFVRFANEEDFLKDFSRESCDVVGVHYRFSIGRLIFVKKMNLHWCLFGCFSLVCL